MSGLVLRNVSVTLGDRVIVDGASLSAPAGALTGILGPNGAGKSTLISAILGLRRPTTGSIAFEGTDLSAIALAERAKFLAYVAQFATTSERLSVRDVVALGRVPFQSTWQTEPSAEDQSIIAAALADAGMSDFALRPYHRLSGGEQQRVQIARALAQQPRLLLLDEPTSHLDIQAQLHILAMLAHRARQGGTLVLALHDLNLAARYCDHLVLMQAGIVVAEGPPADVLRPDLLLQVYGVRAEVLRLPGSAHLHVIYDAAEPHKAD